LNNLALEFINISKSFPGVQALKEVSIQIKKAKVHAIVGENGAGKSTLMKILAGIYQPDSGKIFINGGMNMLFYGSKDDIEGQANIQRPMMTMDDVNKIKDVADLTKEQKENTNSLIEKIELNLKKQLSVLKGQKFKSKTQVVSKLNTLIDNTNRGITSNITKVRMRRDLSVEMNKFATYEICFGNKFHQKTGKYNIKSS
jgi:ABC-type sugar transport system ATPase subunit